MTTIPGALSRQDPSLNSEGSLLPDSGLHKSQYFEDSHVPSYGPKNDLQVRGTNPFVPAIPGLENTITGLQSVLNTIVHDSKQKLERVSRPFRTQLTLSPSSIMQNGLSTLKDLLHNKIPTTLPKILGLAHLAYAAAFMLNPLDLTGDFHSLYRDILTWWQAIRDPAEQETFLQVVSILWAPIESIGDTTLARGSTTNPIFRKPTAVCTTDPSMTLHPIQLKTALAVAGQGALSRTTVLHSIKNGWAVRLCFHFLACRGSTSS